MPEVRCHRRRSAAIGCAACCGTEIEPGDVYVCIADNIDGRWSRVRVHLGCWNILAEICEADDWVFWYDLPEIAADAGYKFDPVKKEWTPTA